jgi:hypothetical protein
MKYRSLGTKQSETFLEPRINPGDSANLDRNKLCFLEAAVGIVAVLLKSDHERYGDCPVG